MAQRGFSDSDKVRSRSVAACSSTSQRSCRFCLQPSALLLILLLAGAALLATRHQKAGRRLVLASTALRLIGGLLPLATWLILPLEERFTRADLSARPVDGIVILGGMEDARVSTARSMRMRSMRRPSD